jgi:hypothetical protein
LKLAQALDKPGLSQRKLTSLEEADGGVVFGLPPLEVAAAERMAEARSALLFLAQSEVL